MRHGVTLALAFVSCNARNVSPPVHDADVPSPTPIATPQADPPSSGPLSSPPPSSVPPAEVASTSPFEMLAGPIRHRFRKTSLRSEDLARLVRASPELAQVGGDASHFDPGDNQFLARSKANREGVTFTTLPLVWRPEVGADLLVATGRGKAGSFVAAWWLLPGGEYRLASSFVLLGEVAPLALAYRRDEPSLWWTTCWQCPGETGHVTLRQDHSVVIVQDG